VFLWVFFTGLLAQLLFGSSGLCCVAVTGVPATPGAGPRTSSVLLQQDPHRPVWS